MTANGRRAALIGLYVLAAAFGYVVGARGLAPFASGPVRSSALARVGFALNAQGIDATREDWEALRADVEAVRVAWDGPSREVFELVAAVRGLDARGSPDFDRAARLCRALAWPRCDRAALVELAKRSRP